MRRSTHTLVAGLLLFAALAAPPSVRLGQSSPPTSLPAAEPPQSTAAPAAPAEAPAAQITQLPSVMAPSSGMPGLSKIGTAQGSALPPPALDGSVARRPIRLGLPVPKAGQDGHLSLEPNVRFDVPPQWGGPAAPNGQAGTPPNDAAASRPIVHNVSNATILSDAAAPTEGPAPPVRMMAAPAAGAPAGGAPAGSVPAGSAPGTAVLPEPIYGAPGAMSGPYDPDALGPDFEPDYSLSCRFGAELRDLWQRIRALSYHEHSDIGVGHERVMLAPMEIDLSQPLPSLRLGLASFYDFNNPDRDEYYFGRPQATNGRGFKLVEHKVDFQEIHYTLEAGGPKFSATTDIPIRMVNPEVNDNVAGVGDISVATKIVLLDGNRWQITQYFKTYTPSGDSHRGLGTGHPSIEPGFLFRYKWSPETYIHSELKYFVPLASDPMVSGQVLTWGIGVSHVAYETDTTAIIPVLELIGNFIDDGGYTTFPTGTVASNDGSTIASLHPGVRFVYDTGGDLGLVELGLSASIPITDSHFYDGMLRAELRWSF